MHPEHRTVPNAIPCDHLYPVRRRLRDLYIAGAVLAVQHQEPGGFTAFWPAQLPAQLDRARVHECDTVLMGPGDVDAGFGRRLENAAPRAPLQRRAVLPAHVAALTALTITSPWGLPTSWRQALAPCAPHLEELDISLTGAARPQTIAEEPPYPALRALRLQLPPALGGFAQFGTLGGLPALTQLVVAVCEWAHVQHLLCSAPATVASLQSVSVSAPHGASPVTVGLAMRTPEADRQRDEDIHAALRGGSALRSLAIGCCHAELAAFVSRLPNLRHLTSLKLCTSCIYGDVLLPELLQRAPELRELQLADRQVGARLALSGADAEALGTLRQLRRFGLHGFNCTPDQAEQLVASAGPVWQKVTGATGGRQREFDSLPSPAWSAAE